MRLLLLLLAIARAGAGTPARAPDVQQRANAILRRLSDPLLLAASPVMRPLQQNAALRPAVESAMQQLRTFQTAAASPPAGRAGELPQPRELVSAHGRLDVHLTLAFANMSTPVGRVTLRAWHLDGVAQVPAPTLRVRPGDVLTLRITNALPAGSGRCARAALASPAVGESDAECANTFHDGNAVNIHTHGLHVSPFYDDVFVRQPPGVTRTYVVPIKREHAPGTAWWHPHQHGAGALHAASGAAGALIVDDPRGGVGDDGGASMTRFAERVLVLSEWRFNGLLSLLSLLNASHAEDYATVLEQTAAGCGFDAGSHDPSGWSAQLDPSCSFVVVNNALRPTLTLRAGAWLRLRIVAATWSSSLALALRGSACEGVLLALDGVPLRPAPLPLRAAALAGGGLLLAPGQRADVALRCSTPQASGGSGGDAHRDDAPALVMMPRDAAVDGIFGAWFQQYLPNDVTRAPVVLTDLAVMPPLRTGSGGGAVAGGGGAAPALPLPSPPPAYLRSLLNEPVQRRHSWAFDAGILCSRVAGSNCVSPASASAPHGGGHLLQRLTNSTPVVTGFTASGLDDVTSAFYINGALYRGAGAPALAARTGEVHEWTLSASWVSPHVVHLHAVPFQVVSYEPERGSKAPAGTGAFLAGAWADSVLVPAGGRVVVRLRFVDAGATLLHCHTLLHHDVGMAAVVDVTAAAEREDAR
jgi:FtsP/CotA-like multicopper oxidase with cupredoxin domain